MCALGEPHGYAGSLCASHYGPTNNPFAAFAPSRPSRYIVNAAIAPATRSKDTPRTISSLVERRLQREIAEQQRSAPGCDFAACEVDRCRGSADPAGKSQTQTEPVRKRHAEAEVEMRNDRDDLGLRVHVRRRRLRRSRS